MIKKDKVSGKREPIPLKANPQCKDCFGRGYVRAIAPHLDAAIYREIRPCHCVKAVMKLVDLDNDNIEVEQAVI